MVILLPIVMKTSMMMMMLKVMMMRIMVMPKDSVVTPDENE